MAYVCTFAFKSIGLKAKAIRTGTRVAQLVFPGHETYVAAVIHLTRVVSCVESNNIVTAHSYTLSHCMILTEGLPV